MKFRAKRKYGNEVITGYYNAIDGVHHYIFNDDNLNSPDWFEIDPTTLAMGTGVTDKNGTMIYGSVPVEGKMSKGGDVCTQLDSVGHIFFSNGAFKIKYTKMGQLNVAKVVGFGSIAKHFTITGKQYEI